MTQRQARKALQAIGMTFRKTETGEYRVAFAEDKHESERCAYYSDDMQDAFSTAQQMRNQRNG